MKHDDQHLAELLKRLEYGGFGRSECFLCARSLTATGFSDEHVVPVWAQRRYDLWDQQLTLQNGTYLPYRQLTVPCCPECNGRHLKPLEDAVSTAVESGYKAVRSLPRSKLLLWLTKLFYGVLFRELHLLADRRKPGGGSIFSVEEMARLRTSRIMLQATRGILNLTSGAQGSLFVFPAQPLVERRLEWDFRDVVDLEFIACRVGEVAMLAAIGDGGALQSTEEQFADIADLPLHPRQFEELCAVVAYQSTLRTRTPKYILGQGAPHQIIQLPLMGFSAKPLFREGSAQDYVAYLQHFTQLEAAELLYPPDGVRTWLRDEEGVPQFIPVIRAG